MLFVERLGSMLFVERLYSVTHPDFPVIFIMYFTLSCPSVNTHIFTITCKVEAVDVNKL